MTLELLYRHLSSSSLSEEIIIAIEDIMQLMVQNATFIKALFIRLFLLRLANTASTQ